MKTKLKLLVLFIAMLAISGITAFAEDDDFTNYIMDTKTSIRKVWTPPIESRGKSVTVSFLIWQNGDITDIKIVKPSGSITMDNATIDAVKKAAPFKHLPESYTQESVEMVLTLNNVTPSAQATKTVQPAEFQNTLTNNVNETKQNIERAAEPVEEFLDDVKTKMVTKTQLPNQAVIDTSNLKLEPTGKGTYIIRLPITPTPIQYQVEVPDTTPVQNVKNNRNYDDDNYGQTNSTKRTVIEHTRTIKTIQSETNPGKISPQDLRDFLTAPNEADNGIKSEQQLNQSDFSQQFAHPKQQY